MSSHGIVRPLPVAAVAGVGIAQAARVLTDEPKEVAVAVGGAMSLALDLGSAQAIDTLFLGFTNDAGAGSLQFSYGAASAWETPIGAPIAPAATKLISPRRHFFKALEAPVTGRYIGVAGNVPAGFQIGVFAVGKGFRPGWGPELGNGRGVIDTGSATRRLDGGFGVVRGARAGAWQWTLGDLTDAERDDLYALLLDRGMTGTVLVHEDLEVGGVLSEKLHWSMLTRVDFSERRDPDLNRWNLKLEDWA